MEVSIEKSCSNKEENKRFISHSYSSKEELVREYEKLYYEKGRVQELYLLVLTELEKAISQGDIDSLKKLGSVIEHITNVEDQHTLVDYYDNTANPIKNTNLAILACKHNKSKILEYLFDNDGRILNNLSIRTALLPEHEDEQRHNGFYYAIRSGNTELLDILIKQWSIHSEQLMDKIISRAYEELKLKNVLLSNETEIFVQKKLIDLRFFSKSSSSGEDQNDTDSLRHTIERIDLTLQSIRLLTTDYCKMKEVDEKFLFIAKSIAQNIHVLKRQVKSSSDGLPWEEMEFCLVCFVSSHTKRQELNLFYRTTLNKGKMLNHLENFARKLKCEQDILKRQLNPEEVSKIIGDYPQFDKLYSDYQQIRDIHSLEKISDNIKLALSVDPKERIGQLIITRALQVIGEHFKNTRDAPKLSNTVSRLVMLSLPNKTGTIIKSLRDSLSHANSLAKRMEIEKNANTNFFFNVQNDIKKVGDVVNDILYTNKIEAIKTLLKKIINSDDSVEIKETIEVLSTVEFNKISVGNFKLIEHDKLEKSVEELSDYITDKTNYETELFDKITSIFSFVGTQSENFRTDYIKGFGVLKSICVNLNDTKFDRNIIKGIKSLAKQTLINFTTKLESYSLNEIAQLAGRIFRSVESRKQNDKPDELRRIICEIFYTAVLRTGNIKWIQELNEKLNEKSPSNPTQKKSKQRQATATTNLTNEEYNKQLALNKMSELKTILSNSSFSSLPSYKSDKQLLAVVEMLVLDIMSILGSSDHYLENDQLFLDDNAPVLTGKCLRNHLAHDNAVVDVLLSDSSLAVILNAKKLTEEDVMGGEKKMGKFVKDNPFALKEKYDRGLATITNQQNMFVAIEEGNLESLKDCLSKGADIQARSINSWTTLHFAAKGPSLEVIKFIVDQNGSIDVKDIKGQSPLHIAAANGRQNIVEFLLNEAGSNVDQLDNKRTAPLHLAAQNGHTNTVAVLLKNQANIARDMCGLSPLHHAIRNNHVDVVKILLEKDENADSNKTEGGYTPLHEAAEFGHLEVVQLLLQNNANINAVITDKNSTALHVAVFNGHLEVVKALIQNGANISSRLADGITPLHCAIEKHHEEIANFLLENGADVDAVDKTYNNTPLHFAARYGYLEILKTLLKKTSNPNIATTAGRTALHFAVQMNHLEMVTVLLEHGVDIEAKTIDNSTPLYYAALYGHKEVAEILIRSNAKVNAKTVLIETPLYAAVKENYKDVAEFLLQCQAEVNTSDTKGIAPLHLAAINGTNGIIELLINNKAEIDIKAGNHQTPLHAAAIYGHTDAVGLLIQKEADINARDNQGFTPLHLAASNGHKDVVNLLIEKGALPDIRGAHDITPLHAALDAGNKEVVEILVAEGVDLNRNSNDVPPLISAIIHNNKAIVEVLIANGADVNAEGSDALSLAVALGYTDIVDVLIKHKASVKLKATVSDTTPLHMAAMVGNKKMVAALLRKKADVDPLGVNNVTPLCVAAQKGYDEVVELLLAHGANVDAKCNDNLTPLHLAAGEGHSKVVKVLLDHKANINALDNRNRTAVQLAVAHGRLEVVKILVQFDKVDLDDKSSYGLTLLHIASERGHFEIVKYLIDEGFDINVRNSSGFKAMHIAAIECHKDIVTLFLSKGLSINDPIDANRTLLFHAAMKGHLVIVKYFIAQGADVNTKDDIGLTPMHVAAFKGYKTIVQVLLENGAAYNSFDKFNNKRPLDLAMNQDIIDLLTSTNNLFEAVKQNNSFEVQNCIKAGAVVNAKNVENVTPLHYAAWKGYDTVVNVLLQNKANPNIIGNKGFTPLHYAAKFSHLTVTKILFSNYAVYNPVSDAGKTPSDYTEDESITRLFELVSESFQSIENDNAEVLNVLDKIEDIDTVKAVMSACNGKNQTLVVAAMRRNFSKVEELKRISQGDVSVRMDSAIELMNRGNYQEALSIFMNALEKRKQILGPDNPGTLDIHTHIATVLYRRGFYQNALNTLEKIFTKQTEMLGLNYKDTLNTKSLIGLLTYRQGKYDEALNIYQEVYQKQKEILGPNHVKTVDTRFHMALVLDRLGKFAEALNINKEIFQKRHEMPPSELDQKNTAMMLTNQGNYEEALKIYNEIFEKKKVVLGDNDSDTLRTLDDIGIVLFKQKKYSEALQIHQEVLNAQKNVLGLKHPDALVTQYNIANVLFAQYKLAGALQTYINGFIRTTAVFGQNHPIVLDIIKHMASIQLILKLEGLDISEILQHLQKDITVAASNGDFEAVQCLLRDGADVNGKDVDGSTPLHNAVSNGRMDVVKLLLKNGADVTQVADNGVTPIHTASSKGYKEIEEVLLLHVRQTELTLCVPDLDFC